jgi:hypothetical protein
MANGSSGAWEIAIDEALSGGRWRAQIEGPSVSLHFEISSPNVVGKIVRFLAKHSVKSKRSSNGALKRGDSLVVGGTNLVPVTLVKDDEFDDRFFFVLGPTDSLTAHFVLAGTDVSEIAQALRQVKEDLDA